MTQIEALTVLYEATVDCDNDVMIAKARRVIARRIRKFRDRYERLNNEVIDENEEQLLGIKSLCARKFMAPISAIDGPSKEARIVQARHSGMWLSVNSGFPIRAVGEIYGQRTHGTVVYAIDLVSHRIVWDSHYRAAMRFLAQETEQIVNTPFPVEIKKQLAQVG